MLLAPGASIRPRCWHPMHGQGGIVNGGLEINPKTASLGNFGVFVVVAVKLLGLTL